MKLQQLQFLASVAQNDLNVTAAAARLGASQPAVSKQLRLLESELGFDIFVRKGRSLARVTRAGERVIQHALRAIREAQTIKGLADDYKLEDHGTLSIGTTHTQARYVLPRVIQQFRAQYPRVQVHLHQGSTEQLADLAEMDRIDFAIATGSCDLFQKFILLPCFQWNRWIVVPKGHELASVSRPTLEQIVQFPIVTYAFSFAGPSSLTEAFSSAGLTPTISLTARDADVIKTYVSLGLGVGIISHLALDPAGDERNGLIAIDASHLFPAHTTWMGFSRHGLPRKYMYDFVQLFAPHLRSKLIHQAVACSTQDEIDRLFAGIELPHL